MRISYKKRAHYDFALQFLPTSNTTDLHIKRDDEHLTLEISDETLGRLLARIGDEQHAVMLPDQKRKRWLITAPTGRQLEQALTRLRHFLVPTYASFSADNIPKLQGFGKNNHPLQLSGARIYPAGYYVLESLPKYATSILQRLDLWMRLEDDCPPLRSAPQHVTYGELYERFKSALASAQWDEAEQTRHTIQRLNLTTAENLLFLEIEQLAQQKRWSEIGKREDFSIIARMQMPRAVRGALLIAFHQTDLLPLEQEKQWQAALEVFQQQRPTLGLLLTGRLGLTQGPVVQVYAYEAAFERDRTALQELITANGEQETLECIKQLLHLLGPEEKKEPVVRPLLSLVRDALDTGDYDSAIRFAEEVEDQGLKAVLLMQIAFHTCDALKAEYALLLFWELTEDEQSRLKERFPFVRMLLEPLQNLVDTSAAEQVEINDTPQQIIEVQNWLEWFALAKMQPDNPELAKSLNRLATISDDRFWTQENILLLNEQLFSMVVQSDMIKHPYVRDALRKIVQFFLSDETFPRSDFVYVQLYEYLYVALLEKRAEEELQSTGFMLLRLADALLHHSPGKRNAIFQNLVDWCGSPMLKLEDWALDAFELLIDYGMEPGLLSQWYRLWVSEILRLQTHHLRTNLEGWLAYGKRIQAGLDLINALQKALAGAAEVAEKEMSDPIKLLPAGYRIGIYSLQESAASRARTLLLERNPELNIRLCTDEVLSDSARAIAQNSQLVVLVTTAMKHAISYGIGPLLNSEKVVYPQSSGSTSIVRAIEAHLRQTEKDVF